MRQQLHARKDQLEYTLTGSNLQKPAYAARFVELADLSIDSPASRTRVENVGDDTTPRSDRSARLN